MNGTHPLDVPWSEYYARLTAQEGRRYHHAGGGALSVLRRDPDSYRGELEAVRDALERDGSFANLTGDDRWLVAGFRTQSSGYIGNMDANPLFRALVQSGWPRIASIVDRLPARGPVAAKVERGVLEELVAISGIAMGVATRLLSVARPDRYFPVNAGSIPGLQKHLGPTHHESEARRVDTYFGLLEQVRGFRWYTSPKPDVRSLPEERFAWSARAALLDAVLFDSA
jgi:hypothetical protein